MKTKPTFEFEKLYTGKTIYGIDEAGLGPLAGPIVVASCCIENFELPDELLNSINDSKKISKKKRENLFEIIINIPNIKYGLSVIENSIIDEIGLSAAWKKGILECVVDLNPDVCLVDGCRHVEIPNCTTVSIVKGDQKSYSIATASIIAKVTRDKIMKKIHEEFPEYEFDKHVGYGTKLHMEKIMQYGPCKYHRKSYAPIKLLINSFLKYFNNIQY